MNPVRFVARPSRRASTHVGEVAFSWLKGGPARCCHGDTGFALAGGDFEAAGFDGLAAAAAGVGAAGVGAAGVGAAGVGAAGVGAAGVGAVGGGDHL